MGRPLNKKYFGNKAAPYTDFQGLTTPDSGTGAEGVAGVTLNARGTYTTRPVPTFSNPQFPGGVLAVGTVTSRAKTLTAAVAGTQTKAYQVSQVLTLGANGTTATVDALAAAGSLTTVTVTSTAGAIAFDTTGTAMLVGTSVTVTGTDADGSGLVAGTYYVKVATATTATLVSTYAAAISGTGGAIVTVVGNTTGLSFATGESAGAAATVSTTPTAKGSYEALVTTAQATTTVGGGEGATVTVANFEADSVVITTAGSGYTSATVSFTQSVTASAVTLTSTAPAAILATAFVTGGSAKAADIIKQSNDRRYKVETADGVMVCQLKTTAAPNAAGEMTISATDGSGKTYYVAKLTSRKAVLVPYGAAGHEFPANGDGTYTSAKWSLVAASTANGVVKLDTI